MAYQCFDFSVAAHVAQIRFNRPDKRNSMTLAFWKEIHAVFGAIAEQPDVRCVVISSSGPHFTAGMDISVFGSMQSEAQDEARRRENLRRQVLWFQECFSVIDRCRVPVLAAVQGGCIGGGVDLISACDMRYCSADAFFVIKEIDLGIVADVGTLQRLPHQMPQGLMRELAYTGRPLAAADAKACGLVNEVYASHEQMLEQVIGIARTIAAKSPLAIVGTKEMLNFARDHTIAEGLNYVATWNAGMLGSADLMAALAGTRAKETPRYDNIDIKLKA